MKPLAPLAAAVVVAAACRSAPRPETPAAIRPPVAATSVSTQPPRPRHTAADADFMRHMIGHHAQALEMTKLVPERTSRQDLRLLSGRIEVSQRDEIAQMRQWLRHRNEPAPSADAERHMAEGHGHLMPGMLTAADLDRLARATGSTFERLFLEYMIRHHEGAITMVRRLFGTQGAAQETETYQFATDVEADQRAEIARMRALLNKM